MQHDKTDNLCGEARMKTWSLCQCGFVEQHTVSPKGHRFARTSCEEAPDCLEQPGGGGV